MRSRSCIRGSPPESASTSGTSFGAASPHRRGRALGAVRAARASQAHRHRRGARVVYKQGSSPRYHAREVAEQMARRTGRGRSRAARVRRWRRVTAATRAVDPRRPARTSDRARASRVKVVDMAAEFAAGHRSMFSRELLSGAPAVATRREGRPVPQSARIRVLPAVPRVRVRPECDSCAMSLTYHEVGTRLRATTAARHGRCLRRARGAAAPTFVSSARARSASRPSSRLARMAGGAHGR